MDCVAGSSWRQEATCNESGLTTVRKAVTITAVAIQADSCDAGKTALVVGGTTADDTIAFNRQGNNGDIEVSINGVSQGVFSPTGHIIVYGQPATMTSRSPVP